MSYSWWVLEKNTGDGSLVSGWGRSARTCHNTKHCSLFRRSKVLSNHSISHNFHHRIRCSRCVSDVHMVVWDRVPDRHFSAGGMPSVSEVPLSGFLILKSRVITPELPISTACVSGNYGYNQPPISRRIRPPSLRIQIVSRIVATVCTYILTFSRI